MTKKEAIKEIQHWIDGCPFEDTKEAFEMAIKALMAYRDCRHCTHNIKTGNMRGCEIWECDFEETKGGAEE